MKAPGSHWDYPMGVLQFFKNCAKKLLAVAGCRHYSVLLRSDCGAVAGSGPRKVPVTS